MTEKPGRERCDHMRIKGCFKFTVCQLLDTEKERGFTLAKK